MIADSAVEVIQGGGLRFVRTLSASRRLGPMRALTVPIPVDGAVVRPSERALRLLRRALQRRRQVLLLHVVPIVI